MKKALILIDEGFQDAEVIYPYYRLIEAGYNTYLAGESITKTYHGKYGYPMSLDISTGEVKIGEFDILIIPGGFAPGVMRTKESYVNIVKDGFDKGVTIGAICHGPQLLVEAGVVNGKNLTAYQAVKEEIISTGGLYSDSEVIIDGKLVTSRNPGDLPAFMRAVIKTAI